jgi:tryptophan synthase beta chain
MVKSEEILPEYWYNIIPDLSKPIPPPRDPPNADFSRIELLKQILPSEIIRQQFTIDRYIKIPEEVREKYIEIGRPTPIFRAKKLEEYLKTPARIYFKYEGATPNGSHKINTAIPQAYYAKNEGASGVVTETGAGQWGTAVALAASLYNLSAVIFMVRVSYEHKPLRRTIMELYGAKVYPSPSNLTSIGKKYSDSHPGSLGIAISEAIEYAINNNYKYLIGSVFDVVLLHQSVIGLEAMKQIEELGEEPEILIGCVGGGSNFGGFVFPFLGNKKGKKYIAVGSAEVPKFSKGKYEYDFPDTSGYLPMIKMITLGKDFVPPSIYSGGLRYHGVSPSISLLIKEGIIEWREYSEKEIYEAAKIFIRSQGIVPAPESAHAIRAVIDEAIKARNENRKATILFNLSGHGLLDLSNYQEMMLRWGNY